MVIVTDRMGSICSSSNNNNNNNATLPPKDLGELLEQAEKGGGSSPWLSEFETFLGKLDRENLARATKPQGNQDCQLKPQLPSESQHQGQLAEEERSIAWRVPLLHFVVEARTVLNVTTTDDRVQEGLVRL